MTTFMHLDSSARCTPLTARHYVSFRETGGMWLVDTEKRVEMELVADAIVAVTQARMVGGPHLIYTCNQLLTCNGRPYGGEAPQ